MRVDLALASSRRCDDYPSIRDSLWAKRFLFEELEAAKIAHACAAKKALFTLEQHGGCDPLETPKR